MKEPTQPATVNIPVDGPGPTDLPPQKPDRSIGQRTFPPPAKGDDESTAGHEPAIKVDRGASHLAEGG